MARTSDDTYAMADTSVPHSYLNVSKPPIELTTIGSLFYKAKAKDVKAEILKHGEGSRGMITMRTWKSGHVCNWEVKNGKVLIYDGQINQTHTLSNLIKRGYFMFKIGRMDHIPTSDLSDPLIRDFVKRSGT